ncbi:hypothetical protein LDENG_00057610 [Lucifuga dentata]|nr:hypothetical protein LDENG_00057610 [Lucifuga dentata]
MPNVTNIEFVSLQSNVHNDYHSPGTSSKQQQLKTPEKPSALLTAISNYSEEEEHLKWEHKSGNAYCDGGFRYSNGYLVVPRNGYYTVYLQVTYENYKPISCFKNVLILESEVHIFQQSYPMNVTLMSMVESVNCSWKTWRKSLYTSAVFHLETNDRMWVTSSHPEFIAQKEQQVFFGAKFESEKPNTAGIT